jgi:2-dehydro-3-deoxygluconokinase
MDLDIVALGEPLIEFNQTREGEGRSYLQGFGGDTSNFAVAAARQGARTAYVSAVGGDAHGQMLQELWEREGVDASGVKLDAGAATGIYFVTHGPEGHRFSYLRAGSAASRMGPADLPLDAIRAAKVTHLSGISLAVSASACDAGYAAVAAAHAAGRLVSFDTNLRLALWPKERARAIILDVMGHADICLPSLDDVTLLTGIDDPDRLVDFALERGARTVALKLGANGALVASRDERHRIPAFPGAFVDASGAGDTFGGSFVARLVAGDDLASAGRYAAIAAGLKTRGYGAVEPIPRKAEVLTALRNWGG